LADNGEIWEAEVEGYNKGGLVVPLDEIRGFVPASQVPDFPRGLNQEERLQRLSERVGDTLMVKVIEINRRKRRLILSARAAEREYREEKREQLLEALREGEVRSGRVSSLASFGAFVDLGGADGLVHISELSWRRVRHPREVVSVGDKVDVYVLRLDQERKRIGLSLKRLQPEPWTLVEEKYELGQLIEGVVTNVVDFGAFAEIEEGIEGLIHVSELTDGSISHPREVVKKGDLLLLRIIRIDARRRRLGLSLKRVLESEWAEWAASLAVAEEEQAERAGTESDAAEVGEEEVAAEVEAEEPLAAVDEVGTSDEVLEEEPSGAPAADEAAAIEGAAEVEAEEPMAAVDEVGTSDEVSEEEPSGAPTADEAAAIEGAAEDDAEEPLAAAGEVEATDEDTEEEPSGAPAIGEVEGAPEVEPDEPESAADGVGTSDEVSEEEPSGTPTAGEAVEVEGVAEVEPEEPLAAADEAGQSDEATEEEPSGAPAAGEVEGTAEVQSDEPLAAADEAGTSDEVAEEEPSESPAALEPADGPEKEPEKTDSVEAETVEGSELASVEA
jgi:small subunit ribosomal protein S1